jgi:transposase
MEARHGTVGKVWIMDRGMASAENLAWLRQTGRRYILGTPKSELRKWAPALTDNTHWREIRAGIEVKLCAAPEGDAETFILCRSRDRGEKEKAMHDRFSRRIEQALAKLQARIAKSKKRLNRDAINRQIGRLLQRNQRAAARFAIELKHADNPAGCMLEVAVHERFDHWAALSEGTYLLRSNVTDWSDEKLWQAYIQLTQAEAAFRIQKDQLAIRPIWHQRADRVQAHILVCFLAFVLWKTLELWQARAGLGNSPRTLLEELARIQAHDVILPTHTHGEIRLRCVTQPDAAQAALLDRLGIVLPKRIRLPEIALAETAARATA